MVSFRGINVHIVTQMEAQRLPEYSTAQAPPERGPTVACYIPLYRGAQFWLEYSIDGPHPPNAMYLFKLYMNGYCVTNWDCMSKHDYHGKAMCCLHTIQAGEFGERLVLQNGFAFSASKQASPPKATDGCIQIKVHRVKQRRRMHQLPVDAPVSKSLQRGESILKVSDTRLIELRRPIRKYQYLLVDPQDEPYATFRFYARTKEYLEHHQILSSTQTLSPTSIATSASRYFDSEISPSRSAPMTCKEHKITTPTKCKLVTKHGNTRTSIRGTTNAVEQDSAFQSSEFQDPHPGSAVYIPNHLESPILKYSIEDLPSIVRPSPDLATLSTPQLPRTSSPASYELDSGALPPPLSPTKGSSPLIPEGLKLRVRDRQSPKQGSSHTEVPSSQHPDAITALSHPLLFSPNLPRKHFYQRHKPSHLKLTRLDGTNFDLNRKSSASSSASAPVPRPLSPFTSGGFLRRLVSSPEPAKSAPRNELQTEPQAHDAIDEAIGELTSLKLRHNGPEDKFAKAEQRKDTQSSVCGPRSGPRGGHSLMSLLGRRVEKRSESRQSTT